MAVSETARHPKGMTRREFLKLSGRFLGAGVGFGIVGGTVIALSNIAGERMGAESNAPVSISETELLDLYRDMFNPEEDYRFVQLYRNPEISREVSYLPRLDSPLDRKIAIVLPWSSSDAKKARSSFYPEAAEAVRKQDLRLPRQLPILTAAVVLPPFPSETTGPYPDDPSAIILDQSFRKQEVIRLVTTEQIFDQVNASCKVNWIGLTKIWTDQADGAPDTLSYTVSGQDGREIRATFPTQLGTVFIPEWVEILSAVPLEQTLPLPPDSPDSSPQRFPIA